MKVVMAWSTLVVEVLPNLLAKRYTGFWELILKQSTGSLYQPCSLRNLLLNMWRAEKKWRMLPQLSSQSWWWGIHSHVFWAAGILGADELLLGQRSGVNSAVISRVSKYFHLCLKNQIVGYTRASSLISLSSLFIFWDHQLRQTL